MSPNDTGKGAMPDGSESVPESDDKARQPPIRKELVRSSIERIHTQIGIGAFFLGELGRQSTEWGTAEDLGIYVEWIGGRLTELCNSAEAEFKQYVALQEAQP